MFNIHLIIERWRYNKDYQIWISTEGRVKKTRLSKCRKPRMALNGYLRIKILSGWIYLHRLVLLTWRPTDEAPELTVDHLNHNKRDCALRDLEWCSSEENTRRANEDLVKTVWGVGVNGRFFTDSATFANWFVKEKS